MDNISPETVAAFEMLKKAVNSMIHSLASLTATFKKSKRKEMYTRRYLRHGKVYTPRQGRRVA